MSTEQDETWEWWQEKRMHYNALLILAIIFSGISFVLIASFGGKYLPEVEFSILSMIGMVFAMPVALLLANLCYTGGSMLEYMVKPNEPERFRSILYKVGCGFSVFVIFYMPLLLLAKVIWRGWL